MGKGLKKAQSAAEDTEHILGILTSLFTNLPSESVPRLRLLAKFVEDGYSKVDRLLDLRDEAEGRLIATERSIDDERQALRAEEIELDQEDEVMFYLRRLEGGLFTLQNIDFILAWLIMEDDGVRLFTFLASAVLLSSLLADDLLVFLPLRRLATRQSCCCRERTRPSRTSSTFSKVRRVSPPSSYTLFARSRN